MAVEIFAVGGITAASMALDRLLPAAALAPVFFWFLRLALEGRLTRRTYSDVGILILALMLPVTLWASALPDKSLTQVYRLVSGILLYYAVVNWVTTPQRLRWLVNGVTGAGLLLASIAPFGVEWQHNQNSMVPASFFAQFGQLLSDSVNPNVMAAFIGFILPLALGLLLFAWGSLYWVERALALVTLLAGSGMLLLTQSRSGFLAFSVALAVLVLLRFRWGWLLFAAVAGGAVYAVYRLGFEGRLDIWLRAYYMMMDFPFTGIGMGLFREITDLRYPLFLLPAGLTPHAHNLYLQIGVDLGLPGLVGWLAALAGVLFASGRVFRAGGIRQDSWQRGLGAGLIASQIMLMVHGIMDAAVWGMVKAAPLVWLVWGLAAAAWLVTRENGEAHLGLRFP